MYNKSQERKETSIKLRYIMHDAGLKIQDCAVMMGIDRKVFYNKLSAGAFSYSELSELLDKIGYDIVWVKRGSKDNAPTDNTFIQGIKGV